MALDLRSTMIGSENPEKLAQFYSKVFGAPSMDDGTFTGWQAGEGFLMVGPHSEVKGASREPARIMFGFMSADVENEFKRIEEAGATVVAKPYHPGPDGGGEMWLATLADPDGNYFQLMSPWDDDMPEAKHKA